MLGQCYKYITIYMLTGYIFVKCVARIMLGSSIPGFLRSYSVQSIEGMQAFSENLKS